MNDIEQHVTSLDLSKRLKELGLKTGSFYWWLMDDGSAVPEDSGTIFIGDNLQKDYFCEICSAYLASELGEILPERASDYWEDLHYTWYLNNAKVGNKYYVEYVKGTKPFTMFGAKNDENESNARAKMLIHLIENGLVDEQWRERWLKN